jgi:transcriptional regulator with XRE-family HTH domain
LSNFKTIIGRSIKQKRLECGFSQEELALKLKTDRQYISKIEGGKINMSLNYLENILKKLNCTPMEFFKTIDADFSK